MKNKNLMIIGLIIALVAVSAFSFGFISRSDNEIDANDDPVKSVSSKQTPSVKQTSKKSTKNGVDLEGYKLIDTRSGTDAGSIQCEYCDSWEVQRTVYEYVNDAGDTVMIGENYCTNCGRTTKDMWQDAEWRDI